MNAERNENAVGHAQPVKRGPHTIRFSAPEWDRIEVFAGARGLSPAAFVRYAALAAIEAPRDTLPGRMAPLVVAHILSLNQPAFESDYLVG